VSTPAVTRADFQQLADVRLKEAKALLDLGMWEGAYYLTGYAVEVALKACIIKTVMATDAFLDKKFSEKCWTHDIVELVRLAGLKPAWDVATTANPNLLFNWGIAEQWSEQKRYHRITETEAKGLYNAVSDATHGVLTWVKTQW
jgi:HEPN domain-containing protein